MPEYSYYAKALPESLIRLVEPYDISTRSLTEPDFYGASGIIAARLGRADIPRSYSSWSHGYHMGPWKYVEQILWVKTKLKHSLVGTREACQFLTQAGVPNVRAVGMPILYTESVGIDRRLKSVLFMPAHSLEQARIDHDEEGLIAQANSLKASGYYVCFCVHQSCVHGTGIVAALERAGIDWFAGASTNDMNSLQRMRNIFEYFEFVASNTMGSHFYYAQLFGARFFFFAPYFEYSLSETAKQPNWRGKEHILEYQRRKNLESAVRQRYSGYFEGIDTALCDESMARAACGESDKVSLETLARLLGWSRWDQVWWAGKSLAFRVVGKVWRAIRR